MRGFVEDDERAPKDVLYPRDPSLDPQLVWKGKDEQDRTGLTVPAVPIYIQEKIHPQAIIEEVRRAAKKEEEEPLTLFADFNGIKFEDQIDFYHHEQNWTNRMILGDSLLVMNSLAEKEGMKGKVQMIYIDPPYGIKFGSNWQVSTKKRDVKDGKADDLTRQPEQIRAFRDTWKLGIHSYLSYLRDRLTVARELLTESGSVFVQIGDENVHLVRCLMDEVFGSENFVALITFSKTSSATTELLAGVCDYVVVYAKDRDKVKYRQLLRLKSIEGDGASAYNKIELPDGTRMNVSDISPEEIEGSRYYRLSDMRSQRPPGDFPVEFRGNIYRPNTGYWKTGNQGFTRLISAERIDSAGRGLNYVRYLNDFPAFPINNLWTDVGSSLAGDKVYVVQTSARVIERCLLMASDPGDLVLDPTCGSGTTAYVAEQWGRRWITCDTSRVALALARTRIMAAKYPYYFLADTPEGVKKEAEVSKKILPEYKTEGDIRKGFVYRRVPHIKLKSIANNPEIDQIHERWLEKLEPLRAKINKGCKMSWEEWEIPREAPEKCGKDVPSLIDEWWKMRRERQKEIDAAIARYADTEVLYDQPYDADRRIRVAGPFTVESLSPHRVLSADDELPATEQAANQTTGSAGFETMILENLRKAGVQNRTKGERLKFDRLEPYAGKWIQATGEYTDTKGKICRVAVAIGPEHGTAGPELVKEAAKEAVQGLGFDLLVVCGFAFDPHVSEEAKRYGKLQVLPAKINPDLMMGEELLKNTGVGNLFMVFGEPDITITKGESGEITVEVHGVDVYDPTTGQIRSNSTDDIACWFIDTEYNTESFFVRHAYFTGDGEPYERLKRALKTEVNEEAWETLYSTKSRPFPRPATGKIAVKVINHYGDEVLKVYDV